MSLEVKIRATDVDAGYNGHLVLTKLSLEVSEGEIVALVGPNGSGKSTVLRALGRVLKPRAGSVLLDGKSIHGWSTRQVAQQLALLPQAPSLTTDLSVEELVWMGRSPHQGILGMPRAADREAVAWAMDETGLGGLRGRPLTALSGGERQRAWIAMALAQRPRVLLLDEPTTFLDLSHQLEVLELIRHLNLEYRLTVVIVLHDLNQAVRYAHRVILLKDGEVHSQGAPTAVLTTETLREVFGVDGRIIPGPDGVPMVIVPISKVSFNGKKAN